MIVAFHTPTVDERGTCIAIYDYAHYNELILHNVSIIITSYSAYKIARMNNAQIFLKFTSRFVVFLYHNSIQELDTDVLKFCDVLYTIKYGTRDSNLSLKTKMPSIVCLTCPSLMGMSMPVSPNNWRVNSIQLYLSLIWSILMSIHRYRLCFSVAR